MSQDKEFENLAAARPQLECSMSEQLSYIPQQQQQANINVILTQVHDSVW